MNTPFCSAECAYAHTALIPDPFSGFCAHCGHDTRSPQQRLHTDIVRLADSFSPTSWSVKL